MCVVVIIYPAYVQYVHTSYHVIVSIYCRLTNSGVGGGSVVLVPLTVSGKETHRQVCVDRVMTSRGLDGVKVSKLASKIRVMGSNPAQIFPIFINP